MNTQLEMDEREQIAEALTTGLRVRQPLACLFSIKGQSTSAYDSTLHGTLITDALYLATTAVERCSVQGFDYLTPLGRGQAQLITGPASSGKSLAALDMILGQVPLLPAKPRRVSAVSTVLYCSHCFVLAIV
jgi:hypothetical protein